MALKLGNLLQPSAAVRPWLDETSAAQAGQNVSIKQPCAIFGRVVHGGWPSLAVTIEVDGLGSPSSLNRVPGNHAAI